MLTVWRYRHHDYPSYRTAGTLPVVADLRHYVRRTWLSGIWLSVIADYRLYDCPSYRTNGTITVCHAALSAFWLSVLLYTTGTIIVCRTGLPALWLSVLPDYRQYNCSSYRTIGIMTVRPIGLSTV